MKEKEQRKERYLEKGGSKRTGGGPLKVAMKGIKKHRERGKEKKERSRAGICVCVSLLNVCVKLCVHCVIPSALKVGDGWTGLI